MADKVKCDACGKEVGSASIHQRIGFTPGSRVNKVCGSCFSGKLTREERLRFAKPAGRRKKKEPEGEGEAWRPGGPTPPDELRF